jgi:hypothetical protein
MKTFLLVLVAIFFVPSVQAAESVLKGPIVGLYAGSWNYKYTSGSSSFPAGNTEYTSYIKTLGGTGGYAYLRDRAFGFEVDGTLLYRIHRSEYESGWMVQVQGNATFGVSKVVYLFAGINWLQDLERLANFSGYGPQGGLAFIVAENWLGKIGYMSNSDLGNTFSFFDTKVTRKYRGFFLQVYYAL